MICHFVDPISFLKKLSVMCILHIVILLLMIICKSVLLIGGIENKIFTITVDNAKVNNVDVNNVDFCY